jgi:uncharacterized repeat protein (TIGR02543 family)
MVLVVFSDARDSAGKTIFSGRRIADELVVTRGPEKPREARSSRDRKRSPSKIIAGILLISLVIIPTIALPKRSAEAAVSVIDLGETLPNTGLGYSLYGAGSSKIVVLSGNQDGYVITGNGGNKYSIAILTGVTANIKLSDVTIDNPSASGRAFYVHPGAFVNLSLEGRNIIKGTYGGIAAPTGNPPSSPGNFPQSGNQRSTVIIDSATYPGSTEGILEATATQGSGIGGNDGSGGIITIKGGTITAKGSVGIGGNCSGNSFGTGAVITINGGIVNAVGLDNYPAINQGDGSVIINGGTVTATNSSSGRPAIGNSRTSGNTGSLTINGGTVSATNSNSGGIGIGGRNNVTITGGTVTAVGGSSSGSGIYANVSGSTITISGGTVKAAGGTAIKGYSAGSVTITGGSVNAASVTPQPRNSLIDIYCSTLTVGSQAVTNAAITSGSIGGVSCAAAPDPDSKIYGIKDVKTDQDGKVYFWLPNSVSELIELYVGLNDYSKTFPRSGTTSETLNPTASIPMHTVTFNSLGGSAISPPTVTLPAGSSVTKPADPARAGYAFGGWYTDSGYTTVWDFNDTVTANLTLYAKWTPTHTVTFNSQGGSAVASMTNVPEGAFITLPDSPERSGFVFDGWYREPSYTSAWNFATDTVTADITLYAKWFSTAANPTSLTAIVGGASYPASLQNDGTWRFDFPAGTDLSAVSFNFTLPPGASVSPSSSGPYDFSGGSLSFTVTAADGVTQAIILLRANVALPAGAVASINIAGFPLTLAPGDSFVATLGYGASDGSAPNPAPVLSVNLDSESAALVQVEILSANSARVTALPRPAQIARSAPANSAIYGEALINFTANQTIGGAPVQKSATTPLVIADNLLTSVTVADPVRDEFNDANTLLVSSDETILPGNIQPPITSLGADWYLIEGLDNALIEVVNPEAYVLPECFEPTGRDAARIDIDVSGLVPQGMKGLLPLTFRVTARRENLIEIYGAEFTERILSNPLNHLDEIFEKMVIQKEIMEGERAGWYTRLVNGVLKPADAADKGILDVSGGDALTLTLSYYVLDDSVLEAFVLGEYLIVPDGLHDGAIIDPIWVNMWKPGYAPGDNSMQGSGSGAGCGGCAGAHAAVFPILTAIAAAVLFGRKFHR